MKNKNIFEKIRDGEEKADIVYKDTYITAFKDIEAVVTCITTTIGHILDSSVTVDCP